jgi:signal transduction histidine kinase
MAEIVGKGVGAERATIWLRVGAELRPEATWPPGESLDEAPMRGDEPPDLARDMVEVRHHDELLGAIGVRMPPSDPLDPAKEGLIADLAAQAGLVLHNSRLVEELRASRQRLVAAQNDERRKLERRLHDGAQRLLAEFQAELREAEQLAGTGPERELELIGRMHATATEALEELRDLARGIFPPLLADRGLPEAIASQARRAPIPVTVEPDGVGRYPREVEATAYFCVLEALENVMRYARASDVVIRLGHDEDGLTFEVVDDGVGFDPASTGYGTGLQGMADRLDAIGGTLDVKSASGRGTRVAGRVPSLLEKAPE